MLLSYFKYACVSTKVRGMYGKLLTRSDYDKMIRAQSVKDIAGYLKNNTGYGEQISNIDENTVHRGDLEVVLKNSLQEDFIKIFNYIRGNPKIFLEAAFLRYEIEDLKVILRILSTGHTEGISHDSLMFLKKYSKLDYKQLAKSESISQFIENLKGTDYYKALAPLFYSQQSHTLFDLEMTLDLLFFSEIFDLKDKLLTGQDRKNISQSFGTEIDILNIMWVYRCKKFFNIPKEVILNKVIPHWYQLTKKQLLDIAGSRDLKDFIEILSTTKYKDVFNPDEEYKWQNSYSDFIYFRNRKNLLVNQSNFSTVMAYLHLKEIDIRNIITVIEGIRYSLPKDEIRDYVVGHYNKR